MCVPIGFLMTAGDRLEAFCLPSDMFDLDVGAEHQCSAEAISDAKVLVIKRSARVALANRDGDAARRLWSFTARELRASRIHAALPIKSAQQRVASFLLEMAERAAHANTIDLPMSR